MQRGDQVQLTAESLLIGRNVDALASSGYTYRGSVREPLVWPSAPPFYSFLAPYTRHSAVPFACAPRSCFCFWHANSK